MKRTYPAVMGETFIHELRAVRRLSGNRFAVVTWGGYDLIVTGDVLLSPRRFASAFLKRHGLVFADWKTDRWRWHVASAMAKAEA